MSTFLKITFKQHKNVHLQITFDNFADIFSYLFELNLFQKNRFYATYLLY